MLSVRSRLIFTDSLSLSRNLLISRFNSTKIDDTTRSTLDSIISTYDTSPSSKEQTKRSTSEVNNNDSDDVEPRTLLEKNTITQKTLCKYQSLKDHNDPPSLVPHLTHNLESTLFSPGVHYMVDPRTRKPNYDPSLLEIPHIDELKMEKVGSFTPSSRDKKLLSIAAQINAKEKKKRRQIKYFSSTSSMTSLLIKFHKYLSNNRPINTTSFSKTFPDTAQFTSTSDVPTSLVVTKKADGIFSVDADRSVDSEITLSVLGNALELMLTKTPEEFAKYLTSSELEPDTESDASAYHYAKIGSFMVRSQLDAFNENLPGTGTFDIKTRAVCAIRMDLAHTDYFPTNYEITKTHGLYESFERELYDAARIVMFKYSLQARLGNMDGIFMAFHNIKKFLGFQYLPLTEIDNIFYGDYELKDNKFTEDILEKKSEEKSEIEVNTNNQNKLQSIVEDYHNDHQTKREALSTFVADYEMRISMELLQRLLDRVTKELNGKPFRIIFKKVKGKNTAVESTDGKPETYNSLVCIVNPLETAELSEMQTLASDRIEKNKYLISHLNNKTMSASDRIKFFTEFSSEFRNKYFKLNRSILRNSEKDILAYEIKATHIFNGKECEDQYPFPDVGILDTHAGKSSETWDVGYEINSINREQDKKYLYNKFTRDIAFNSFRDFESADTNVYTDSGVIFDQKASLFQNVTRAYSAKAIKRASTRKTQIKVE